MQMTRPSGQLSRIISALFCVFLAAALVGAAGDGGCSSQPADQLCAETGGTWGPGEFWPPKCGDDPLVTKGPAAGDGESVCACPADKPNWSDGVGCRKCESPREVCTRTGGTWGPGTNWPPKCGEDPEDGPGPEALPGESVCTCPAGKPNWTDGEGCKYCKSEREICTSTGGTWGLASYWPAPCGDDPLLAYGRPAESGKRVCICPTYAPNWTDTVGCRNCPIAAGACEGGVAWCKDFSGNEQACWQQIGCHWGAQDSPSCWGIASGCSKFQNALQCAAQRGCNWNPVSESATPRGNCRGGSAWCSDFHNKADMCWMQRGCRYDYGNNQCKGYVTSCSDIHDERGCVAQRGCTWSKS